MDSGGGPELSVGDRGTAKWGPVKERMALGESHSVPSWPPRFSVGVNWKSVCRWIMIFQETAGGKVPRLIIYSDSGPLAGDLGACLSGRFLIQRVTSLSAATLAIDQHSAALLVVPGRRTTLGPELIPLYRRAVKHHCRVLLLGCDQSGLDQDLQEKIQVLPQFPSPEILFNSLLNGEKNPGRAQRAEGS